MITKEQFTEGEYFCDQYNDIYVLKRSEKFFTLYRHSTETLVGLVEKHNITEEGFLIFVYGIPNHVPELYVSFKDCRKLFSKS
jgi:nucleoid-associated protein YejK